MTLEEFDSALEKTGLDLSNNPNDMELRDKILTSFGKDIIEEKKHTCDTCWLNENGKCSENCRFRKIDPGNPLESAKSYLGLGNEISTFAFMYRYMIPVYEEVTGDIEIRERMRNRYNKLMAQRNSTEQSG